MAAMSAERSPPSSTAISPITAGGFSDAKRTSRPAGVGGAHFHFAFEQHEQRVPRFAPGEQQGLRIERHYRSRLRQAHAGPFRDRGEQFRARERGFDALEIDPSSSGEIVLVPNVLCRRRRVNRTRSPLLRSITKKKAGKSARRPLRDGLRAGASKTDHLASGSGRRAPL